MQAMGSTSFNLLSRLKCSECGNTHRSFFYFLFVCSLFFFAYYKYTQEAIWEQKYSLSNADLKCKCLCEVSFFPSFERQSC